jgi:hypothetical protein
MAQEPAATLLDLTGDLWLAPGHPPARSVGESPKDASGRSAVRPESSRDWPAPVRRRPAGEAEDETRDLGDSPPAAANTRVSNRSTAIAAAPPASWSQNRPN